MRRGCGILVSAVLAGCAINQTVEPFKGPAPNEICIIENPDVRPGVLAEYRKTLEEFGYRVRVLPENGHITDCMITSSYVARWSWDWFWTAGAYMSLAEIKVYKQGQLAGEARYDSTGGVANPKWIIHAAPKIRELVTELFPQRSDGGF